MNKEQLEKLSDLMLNEHLAMELGLLVAASGHNVYRNDYRKKYPSTIWVAKHIRGEQIEPWEQVNYCTEPSDMWPLILDKEISINFRARKSLLPVAKMINSDSDDVTHKNPLRAAAIVYLLMQGEGNE